MKKTILTIIVALILLPAIVNANQNYDYIYKGKIYNIYYPENIEHLEYQYLTGELSEDHEYFNLVFINLLLVKMGANPIW